MEVCLKTTNRNVVEYWPQKSEIIHVGGSRVNYGALKIEKANELGVKTLTEKEFKELIK